MESKNNYTYVGVSFIVLIFGILFVPKIVDRFKNQDVVRSRRLGVTLKDRDTLAYITVDKKRKKLAPFSYLNQDSLFVTHLDMKDKVCVVDFFFTSCPTICPKMTSNLVYIQKELAKSHPDADYHFLSFTINPNNDTPMALKRYSEFYKADTMHWDFLTGDRSSIYKLAKEGYSFYVSQSNQPTTGGFEHSGFFALIDQQGNIRSRYDQNGNPIIYYRGTVTPQEKVSDNGEPQQVTLLLEDIRKLLDAK